MSTRISVVRRRALAALFAAGVAFAGLPACNNASETASPGGMQASSSRAGEPVDDATLTARIRQALAADKTIDPAAISFSVKRGEVTLNGTVASEQIPRIDRIVSEVAGVKVVINALRSTHAAS